VVPEERACHIGAAFRADQAGPSAFTAVTLMVTHEATATGAIAARAMEAGANGGTSVCGLTL